MSVQVKTPTKTQFEHAEFQCGDQSSPNKPKRPSFGRQDSCPVPGKIPRKRRHSERVGESNRHQHGNPQNRRRMERGKKDKIVLPTKFLLGGNINDPLNLNSLCDESINEALNQVTPVSSPIPLPQHRKQVHVLIPPNITDPLNLNSGEDIDVNLISPKQNKKKRNKHKHKKRGPDGGEDVPTTEASFVEPQPASERPNHLDLEPVVDRLTPAKSTNPEEKTDLTTPVADKVKKIIDKIVSPVIPQVSPKSRKRRRTASEGEGGGSSKEEEPPPKIKIEKPTSPVKPKGKRASVSGPGYNRPKHKPNAKDKKFIYGNYNRYYGYRNPDREEDPRLKCFHPEWFEGKDVLDIGCNVGHVTLSIAKNWLPNKIVGMEIDGSLVKAARQNVRHYMTSSTLSSSALNEKKFPVSNPTSYGPVSAPLVVRPGVSEFPNNVAFVQANYVLERDELVDLQEEEYDIILGLSVTKWMHLNSGDAGMKRTFRRMFRQLRPGGKLILEPQSWASYKKKKKLTEDIHRTFKSIKFKPDQFTEYLLSRECGFSKCESLDIPFNKSKGFQRPLQVYTKSDTAFPTPYREPLSACQTPCHVVMETRESTPRFTVGTPSTVCSGSNTPRLDSGSATPHHSAATDSRPLDAIRINSAPGLLESSAFMHEQVTAELEAVKQKSLEVLTEGEMTAESHSVEQLQVPIVREAAVLRATDVQEEKDREVAMVTEDKQKDIAVELSDVGQPSGTDNKDKASDILSSQVAMVTEGGREEGQGSTLDSGGEGHRGEVKVTVSHAEQDNHSPGDRGDVIADELPSPRTVTTNQGEAPAGADNVDDPAADDAASSGQTTGEERCEEGK